MGLDDDRPEPVEEGAAPVRPADAGASALTVARRGRRAGRWRPGWRRLVGALTAGGLLAAGMPPRHAWFLMPAGAAVLFWSLISRDARQRLVIGAVAGLAYFTPTLGWLTGFHPAGFAAVLVVEVALFATSALAVDGRASRWWTVPAALVALEAVRARFPFGGFPLPGMALGQLDGPFAQVAPLGGSLLVVGVAAGAGAALAGAVAIGRHGLRLAAVVVAAGAAGAAIVALEAPAGADAGRLEVALVQGGGPRGIPAVVSDADAVTERQFRQSRDLPTGLDLVLWPENSLSVDGPVAGKPEAERVAELAQETRATVVVGLVETYAERFRNAAVAWGPDGRVLGRYEKVHRVPFGEYIPARSLFDRLSDLTGLVPRDAIAGRGPGLLRTPAGPMGVVISYEVFFSDRVADAVTAGGQVVLVPTNAASYTTEEVPATEVAAARMRALEFDRTVLQAAPTGYTAVVLPDGTVVAQGGLGTPEVLTASVPLRTSLTPYARTGDGPVLGLAAAALVAGPATRLLRRRRARRPRRPAG